MILLMTLFPRGPAEAEPLMSLSPIFASVNLCELMSSPYRDPRGAIAYTSTAVLAVFGAAAVLFWLTYASFDRCLGRIPDWKDELRLKLRRRR
jgi:hypothetical protein